MKEKQQKLIYNVINIGHKENVEEYNLMNFQRNTGETFLHYCNYLDCTHADYLRPSYLQYEIKRLTHSGWELMQVINSQRLLVRKWVDVE